MTYSDLPGVNFSTLKHIAKSPLHYAHACKPRQDSDVFRVGRALHSAVLEPAKFLTSYTSFDGERRHNKKNPSAWDLFCAEWSPTHTILTTKQMTDVLAMADALAPVVAPYLEGAEVESVRTWVDDVTGIACKGRRDLVQGSTLVEIKTAARLDYNAFQRQIVNLDYHTQLSWYGGPEIARHLIIAVEKEAPYDTGVFEIDPEAIAVGARRWRGWLDLLQQCRERGEWPGRYPDVTRISLPSYLQPVDETDLPEDYIP